MNVLPYFGSGSSPAATAMPVVSELNPIAAPPRAVASAAPIAEVFAELMARFRAAAPAGESTSAPPGGTDHRDPLTDPAAPIDGSAVPIPTAPAQPLAPSAPIGPAAGTGAERADGSRAGVAAPVRPVAIAGVAVQAAAAPAEPGPLAGAAAALGPKAAGEPGTPLRHPALPVERAGVLMQDTPAVRQAAAAADVPVPPRVEPTPADPQPRPSAASSAAPALLPLVSPPTASPGVGDAAPALPGKSITAQDASHEPIEAGQLRWNTAGRLQTAQINLSQPESGAVKVDVKVDNDTAKVHFATTQPVLGDALESSLPRLRLSLHDAGFQSVTTSVSVSADAAGRHSHLSSYVVDPGSSPGFEPEQAPDGAVSAGSTRAAGSHLIDCYA
jgi:hypothetical protein